MSKNILTLYIFMIIYYLDKNKEKFIYSFNRNLETNYI